VAILIIAPTVDFIITYQCLPIYMSGMYSTLPMLITFIFEWHSVRGWVDPVLAVLLPVPRPGQGSGQRYHVPPHLYQALPQVHTNRLGTCCTWHTVPYPSRYRYFNARVLDLYCYCTESLRALNDGRRKKSIFISILESLNMYKRMVKCNLVPYFVTKQWR